MKERTILLAPYPSNPRSQIIDPRGNDMPANATTDEVLILDMPHMEEAALCKAYRYWLWLVDGHPEVWHNVPYKKEGWDKKKNKEIPAIPPHWVRLVSIDAIPRLDAKQELRQAWDQDAEWRSAYGAKK